MIFPVACNKKPQEEQELGTRYYANLFAFNIMKTYYLWEADVAGEFDSWTYGADPIEKVQQMRYKDASGRQVDKWTRLMEDCSSFLGSVTGNTKSFGFDFVLYYVDASHQYVCAVVTFTYAGSPAEKAGIKRGDIILSLDGQKMTPDNYADLINSKLYGGGTVRLGLSGGAPVSLTAVQMYENPVHTVKVLEAGGKKIGYLHFTGFTMDATRDLETAFRKFKQEQVEEIILDLRYNSGGYTLTSTVLASMLVPVKEVKAGSIFNREVYNQALTEALKDKDGELASYFADEFDIPTSSSQTITYTVHPLQVNPEIRKLWVITTGSTASASEALICGLKPYMDISLVGEKTYGKFCGGYLIEAEDFFQSMSKKKDLEFDCDEGKEKLSGWGIYVITSRYSDKDGVTLSMPDGIQADFEVNDNPVDGYELGDPSETMLAKVLELTAGKRTRATVSADPGMEPVSPVRRPGFGVLLYPSAN